VTGPGSDLTVSVGAVAAAAGPPGGAGARRPPDRDEVVLDLGPQHPSAHGGLRLRLRLDGDRIATCEPEVGFLHRGVEKLFEARDYRQIVMLANRHDWLSAFANELGVVLAVERMLGIEVPARAVWARTLLAELNRVTHHLMFLALCPPALASPPLRARLDREAVLGVMEELTGGRMHFMFNRVGGLKEDLPGGWLDSVLAVTARVREGLPALRAATVEDPRLVERTRGVGVLSGAAARAYGASGPVGRASGLDLDLRRDEPHLGYGELAAAGVLRVALRVEGDALARFEVLAEQLEVALDLVEACVDRLRSLPPGPVGVRLPKIVKAPEGATYAWTESPGGLNGYYLVSRGEKTPYRLKLRTPGFNHAAALPAVVTGGRVADLVAVLASMFFVVGDIDK
jgi:NADH-quinone oxidoreductase subunit D